MVVVGEHWGWFLTVPIRGKGFHVGALMSAGCPEARGAGT